MSMIETNWAAGSSRRNCSVSVMCAGSTVSVSSPNAKVDSNTAPGAAAASFAAMVSSWSSIHPTLRPLQRSRVSSAFNRARAPDLFLEHQHPVKQRFSGGRTARHVDIHRHDTVASSHHRIGIMVIAAAIGARAHRDDVTRFRHLVVNLPQRGSHLVGQRPRHDHHIRLARAPARREAEPLDVIARHRQLPHLDSAAGKAKIHPRERASARPLDEVVGRGDENPLVGKFVADRAEVSVLGPERPAGQWIKEIRRAKRGGRAGAQSHSSAPLFHSYTNPIVSTPRNNIIDQNPSAPRSWKTIAQGNRNATSRSKIMKRSETK